MSQSNWVGRLLGKFSASLTLRPFRHHTKTKLELSLLPGRDGPSLLTGVEVNLLAGASCGIQVAGSLPEPNFAEIPLTNKKLSETSPSTEVVFETLTPFGTPNQIESNQSPTDPLPSSLSAETTASNDTGKLSSSGNNYFEPSHTTDANQHPGNSSNRSTIGSVTGTASEPSLTHAASSLTFVPVSINLTPTKTAVSNQSIATVQRSSNSNYAAFSQSELRNVLNSKSEFSETNHELNSNPIAPDSDPSIGTITETPPTFVEDRESFQGSKVLEGEQTGSNEPPPGETAGGSPTVSQSEQSPEPTFGSGGNLPEPGSAGVTSHVESVSKPLVSNAELFRISGVPTDGSTLEVRYTLSAHDSNGTISVEGTAFITTASTPVVITAGAALAGRSPDIVTIQLKDAPGVRLLKSTGTLFLTPAGARVGDSALFEAHRVGKSSEAFEQLVQRHTGGVFRSCQRIVGNRADAEDVTQFVFLTLAQWQLRFPGTLTGWLHTVARNASYAFLRSKSRRIRHEREAAKPEISEPLDANSLADEGLDVALSKLPAPLEEAVRLRYLEGWSQQEAAQIVGCPRGTLSRRAANGIETLREILTNSPAISG